MQAGLLALSRSSYMACKTGISAIQFALRDGTEAYTDAAKHFTSPLPFSLKYFIFLQLWQLQSIVL